MAAVEMQRNGGGILENLEWSQPNFLMHGMWNAGDREASVAVGILA